MLYGKTILFLILNTIMIMMKIMISEGKVENAIVTIHKIKTYIKFENSVLTITRNVSHKQIRDLRKNVKTKRQTPVKRSFPSDFMKETIM